MSLKDCLDRATAAGEIDRSRAAAAFERFESLAAEYERTMPRAAAEAAALADLKEATRQQARRRFHATVNQLRAARQIKIAIEGAPDPAVAIRNLLERSAGSGYQGDSVRSLAEAYMNQANGMIAKVLQKHSTNLVGEVRQKAAFNNMLLEAHGRDTGDAVAKELAEALQRAQQYLRQAFNAQGGDIGNLLDYGLAHTHSVVQLRKMGFERWSQDITPLLDWSKIRNYDTGRMFADEPGVVPPRAQVERFLKEVYENIVSGGWANRDAGFGTGGRALYNQRAEHRVLQFIPEGYVTYNKAYGASDPFSAMLNGLHGLANDVALMRVLGPNPKAGLAFAEQVAQKRAAELVTAAAARQDGSRAARRALKNAEKLQERVRASGKLTRAMLAHQDGSANVPGNAAWASFFTGTRAVLVSTQLGSAVLSSVTDLATIASSALVMGMNPATTLGRSVQLMASQSTRETAARMGYIAGTLADAGGGYSRFMGQTLGSGIPERLAGFTLRASGLSFLTDMHKTAFRMEISGNLAENAGRAFDEIEAPLRRSLESRGLTAAEWDKLRAPEHLFTAPNGSTFLSPYYWYESVEAAGFPGTSRAEAEALSTRLAAIIEEELEFAVPTASLEGRARIMGEHAPGTIGGELLRSGLMYKSYPLSLTLGMIRRFNSLPTPQSKAMYAVGMASSLTILGAVAVQLKELAKGRDPRPMDSKAFWMAAMFQGGGLGIFGDFFHSETSRAGGGLAETAAGPVISLAGDVIGMGASNIQRAAEGEDLLLGRDVANLVRFNTPVASSLWYTRLAFDRMVFDELQRFLDPEAEAVWRRQERQRQRDFGSRSWWERGEMLPARRPDLRNALEDSR
jgi:hypothetical protein